jgi:hypothetical protein
VKVERMKVASVRVVMERLKVARVRVLAGEKDLSLFSVVL